MRTTLDISDALLKELRQRASASGRPFRKVVEETLHVGLAAGQSSVQPVTVKTYPVGIKAAYRGLSMNQLYDQVEAESHFKVAES